MSKRSVAPSDGLETACRQTVTAKPPTPLLSDLTAVFMISILDILPPLYKTRRRAQDYQGSAQCALAQIVGGFEQTWEGTLAGATKNKGNHAPAKVVIRAEEVAMSNALVDMVLDGSSLR